MLPQRVAHGVGHLGAPPAREHFAMVSKTLDRPRMEEAYGRFAVLELRKGLVLAGATQPGAGEPRSRLRGRHPEDEGELPADAERGRQARGRAQPPASADREEAAAAR